MREETYRRSQVEWALWRLFALGNTGEREAPQIFRTRIKRLLEIDRGNLPFKSDTSPAPHAFASSEPEGRGTDASFAPFDAFCLALGLDMLDVGLKQLEIVYFLRHMRHELEGEYRRIMALPPVSGQASTAGIRLDRRLYAVIGKIEMKEVLPRSAKRGRKSEPVMTFPRFCRGMDDLRTELDNVVGRLRKALVFELSHMAITINEHLREAPVAKRGRPSGR